MKYIRQFAVILVISFLGEVLRAVLPLPVPASIYGLLLMLAALCLHIIPLEAVRESGRFLIEIMPLMFIPAAVGLLESWGKISPILWQLLIITAVSTVAVMAVAGRVTQFVIRLEEKAAGGESTKTARSLASTDKGQNAAAGRWHADSGKEQEAAGRQMSEADRQEAGPAGSGESRNISARNTSGGSRKTGSRKKSGGGKRR